MLLVDALPARLLGLLSGGIRCAGLGLRRDAGPLQDGRLGQDGDADAHRDGVRVGGARVELHVPALDVIFAGMLACLGGALARITALERGREALSVAQHLLVQAPLSVFAGWTSAAVLANVSVALKASDALPTATAQRLTAAGLIAAAGAAGAGATTATQGNRWYAGTVLWTLVAIAVAAVQRREPVPSIAAAAVAGLVGMVAARAARTP